jgi:hypothetical protein
MKSRNNILKGFGTGLVGAAALVSYVLLLRPRILGWGASKEEVASPMPGDELLPNPITITTRAININAPVDQIWPWLVQIGQGRGGFYSYDWLENIFGLNIHNADRILPNHQHLNVGDLVPFVQGAGVTVQAIDPPKLLVTAGSFDPRSSEVGGTWTFILQKRDAITSRLIVRTRIADFPPSWLSRIFSFALLEPAHFVMEQKMLRTIKDRVENYGKEK